MFHHPNCPYYRQTQQCVFACHLLPPGQLMQLSQTTQQHSNAVFASNLQSPPPPYYPIDPVRFAQIRQGFSRAADRLDELSQLCDERAERRVHFEQRRRDSLCADGTTDIRVYERNRTTRRSLPSPTPDVIIQHQPHEPVLRSILRPVAKVIRDLPLTPVQPTIYIVTFAADTIPNHGKNVKRLLDDQIPRRNPPIPHLYTIDARSFQPPSQRICERYSGISPIVQDIVMQDRGARKAVKNAVQELLNFGLHERQKAGGKREVSMSVCCHMGTHRSVALGERIAQGVKSEVGRAGVEEGVRVVVRHVHRIKGRGDPF